MVDLAVGYYHEHPTVVGRDQFVKVDFLDCRPYKVSAKGGNESTLLGYFLAVLTLQ